MRPVIGMDDSSGVQRETGNPNVIGAQGEIDPVEIIEQDKIAKAPAEEGQEKGAGRAGGSGSGRGRRRAKFRAAGGPSSQEMQVDSSDGIARISGIAGVGGFVQEYGSEDQ